MTRKVVAAGRMPNQEELDQIRTDRAFDAAIGRGIFSLDETRTNYVGGGMYMFTSVDGVHSFKSITTRQYISV